MAFAPELSAAATRTFWSAVDAAAAVADGDISLIDVRSLPEWLETGLAEGAWPISMHEDRFEERLFAARDLSGARPVAMICATGGRSGQLLGSLTRAGYSGFIDISEGMLGSQKGPGWIVSGLPTTDLRAALADLPASLR